VAEPLREALATPLSRHGSYSLPLLDDLEEAIHNLLGRDHVVVVNKDGWVLEHSLECRLSGRMAECHLNYDLTDYGAPVKPGRYRCQWDPDGIIDFEPIKEASDDNDTGTGSQDRS
jgi:hypothetical protein